MSDTLCIIFDCLQAQIATKCFVLISNDITDKFGFLHDHKFLQFLHESF